MEFVDWFATWLDGLSDAEFMLLTVCATVVVVAALRWLLSGKR
jgi:hypothetical protein